MSRFKMKDKAEVNMVVKPDLQSELTFMGVYKVDCFDKDNNLKWSEIAKNTVVEEGINHILDVQFHAESQETTWYIGLKETGSEADGDTLASHGGWAEFEDYSGFRQEFVEAAASSKSITNTASPATFNITGSGTIDGCMVASVLSGSAGILFSATDFGSPRTVANTDIINVTWTLTGADA